MKRLLALLSLIFMSLAAPAFAEGPEDMYVRYWNQINDADSLLGQNKGPLALKSYKEAEAGLKVLQKNHPKWYPEIVKFRLDYIAQKVGPLEKQYGSTPAPGSSKAAPVVPATKGAPATTPAPVTATTKAPAAPAQKAADIQHMETYIGQLHDQIIDLRTEKGMLELKLKEALGARPAATEPQELAKATTVVSELKKENEVLKAALDQERQKGSKLVDSSAADKLKRELADAQRERDRAARQVAELTRENEAMAKRSNNPDNKDAAREIAALRKESSEKAKQIAQTQREEVAARALASKATDDARAAQREAESLRKQLESMSKGKNAPVRDERTRLELAEVQAKLTTQEAAVEKLRKENEKMEKLLTDPNFGAPVKDTKSEQQVAALSREKAALEARARDLESQLRAATSASPKSNPNDSAKIRSLENEKDLLEKQLKDARAMASASSRSNPKDAARIKQLEDERETLEKQLRDAKRDRAPREMAKADDAELSKVRAQLDALQAKKVPYTAEELALFKKPTAVMESARAGGPSTTISDLPSASRALVTEGQRAFAAKRYDEAEKKFTEVLKLSPDSVLAMANMAAIQIERNRSSEAEKHLNKALQLAPNDPFSLSLMGIVKSDQGKTEEAFELLSRSAKLDPNNPDTQNYLGIVLNKKGQREAGESALRKAIQLAPGHASAHHNLAVVYATAKEPMLEMARWHYQKALSAGHEKNPDLEKRLAK